MYTLLELQTALGQYEKARPFYESEPALIINLKKIAARSPLKDADQLLIIKELLSFSDKEEKSISKNCAEVIKDLRAKAGRENLACFKILLDKNLFTLENLNAIKTKPHLVDNLLYLKEHGSSLIDQNCLDLLICSAFGEEPEEYSKIRTEHLCCLLLQFWKYQLLDEAKSKLLIDQVKLNRKANASYTWKDYPLVHLTSENNPPLTKGKLYMKVEDKGYRHYYNLKFYWIDSESQLITFENSNLLLKTDGAIGKIPQILPWIVNQAYLHQIDSDSREWSASVSQQLLQEACKQKIDFSKYKYSHFEKTTKVFSTIQYKGRENYLVFYLKALQILEAQGLLTPENIHLLLECKNCSDSFVTFLTQFANNNLLNKQNFENLCSFDWLLIFNRNGLVKKLGELRLLSQPLIDMIWKFETEPQKHFHTPSDIEHIKALVDLIPLSPEKLLELIQQGKVRDVMMTFKILKEAGLDAPELSSAIIDKILKSPEYSTSFSEVVFGLHKCKFLNKASLMMLINLDPILYHKMYACTESLYSQKDLLTQENLETLVINYQNVHDPLAVKMSEGYQHLHENGLYTKENKKLLLGSHHGYPKSLACSLVLLAKNGLLSKNSGRLTFQYDSTFEGAFKCLQENQLLNQKNLDKLFLGSPSEWHLRTVSLYELHRLGWSCSQKSLDSLLSILDSNISPQSRSSLNYLAGSGLLTEDNLQVLEESHRLPWIGLNLNLLADAFININQTDFNELVQYANILDPGLLARIPRRLFTRALLNDLFIRCITFQTDPNPQDRLEEYINRIINPAPVLQQRVAPAHPTVVLNGAQSTHTADVHKTVSKSAIILNKMYSLSFDEKVIFEEIVKYIKSLPKGDKNDAAKRLLKEMKNHQLFWSFSDPVSKVTNHQMLVLSWVAIHDEKKRQGTLDNAKERFVNSLYEVQRGYNLDEDGIDDGRADDTICCAGTFNKIVEGLYTIHHDVKIKFISKVEAAKLKLRDSVFVTKKVVEDLRIEKLPENKLKKLKEEINKVDFKSPKLIKSWKRVEKTIIKQKSEYESVFKNKQEYIKACQEGFWAIDIEKIIQAIDDRLAPKKQEAPKIQAPTVNGFFKSDKKPTPEMELPLWIKLLFCLPIIGQLGCLIYLFLDWCFPGKAEENGCGCLI